MDLNCSADGVDVQAYDLPSGHLSEKHMHDEAQLLFSVTGMMRVETDDGLWTLPPQRALWIPAKFNHEMYAQSDIKLRTVYVNANQMEDFFSSCKVLNVTKFLRELILRAVELYKLVEPHETTPYVSKLLLAEIRSSHVAPLLLKFPKDPRAKRVADALMENPRSQKGLDEWAKDTGASARTLTRCFSKETGMTFQAWRRMARLMSSLEFLAEGRSVTDVANCCGYDSQSAFHVAFQSHFGTTPGRFFEVREN